MNIQKSLSRIKTQLLLNKTVGSKSGSWDLSLDAVASVEATVNDQANYHVAAVKCSNCGLLISSLLVEVRCPNCGGLDFEEEQGVG